MLALIDNMFTRSLNIGLFLAKYLQHVGEIKLQMCLVT